MLRGVDGKQISVDLAARIAVVRYGEEALDKAIGEYDGILFKDVAEHTHEDDQAFYLRVRLLCKHLRTVFELGE
jgi:hypothetical protein